MNFYKMQMYGTGATLTFSWQWLETLALSHQQDAGTLQTLNGASHRTLCRC